MTTQVRSQELKGELAANPELEGFSIVDLREGSGHIKIRYLES